MGVRVFVPMIHMNDYIDHPFNYTSGYTIDIYIYVKSSHNIPETHIICTNLKSDNFGVRV